MVVGKIYVLNINNGKEIICFESYARAKRWKSVLNEGDRAELIATKVIKESRDDTP